MGMGPISQYHCKDAHTQLFNSLPLLLSNHNHMNRPLRFLGEHNPSSTTDSPNSATVDSDFVVILAALLCALICVIGLVAVARCAWLRRLRVSSISSTTTARPSAPPALASSANKGLKNKILRSLPKLAVTAESAAKFSDCAICLSELSAGDEIRVLPQCGHGFHVSCIDTWLGSHSSCPSCRQILVVGTAGRCDKCGGLPATATGTSTTIPPAHQSDSEATIKERGEHLNNTFLP